MLFRSQYGSVSGGAVEGDIIIFDNAKMELKFEGLANRPVPSLLREFSAPVEISDEADLADRLFLAQHDGDPFNRWQTLNNIGLELLSSSVRNQGEFF